MSLPNINRWVRCKIYEPVPRKFGGSGVQYVPHRFEIKDGISWRDVLIRNNTNKLLKMVKIP